ncbi:MAG TPA: hypothetical protein VFS88_04195 [Micavibrio sp.]|nr:hypothetical protein [Micavibrio sp.]
MEDIEKRLRESTDACIKSFENWVKQNKNVESRESLMETMHEVRKIMSRIEIEIAISERDRMGARPIPIPPHRSSRKREGVEEAGHSEDDFNVVDGAQPASNEGPRRQHQGGRGRRPMRSQGGSGNHGNGDSQPQ